MSDALQTTVPVFKLYGEKQPWPTPDLLHCELIKDRSGPQNWYIPPHRHADLLHILYIRDGYGELHLEGNNHHFDSPCLLVVPAMAIHGFDFMPDTDGYALTLAKPLVDSLSELLGQQGDVLHEGACYPLSHLPNVAETVVNLVVQTHEEYLQPADGRDPLLHGLIQALAVQIARRSERSSAVQAPQKDKGHSHLIKFQQLVEQHYKRQPSIASLADQLGITGTHLNTLCQRLMGCSALAVLHDRLLLEAKRYLTYTNLTVSQVSDDLGFSEPAYFTRFFKRHCGCPPKVFRMQQR